MPAISQDLIDSILQEYQVSATPTIRSGVRTHISLLQRWNKRISLTSITDPVQIMRLHFGESMFAASAVPIRDGRLADVGTGAGFPGLPLKIVVPSLNVVLIESNARKAAFLSECIRELNLSGLEVVRDRFENLSDSSSNFDFITARALGAYGTLVQWAQKTLSPRGTLVLWLGRDDAITLRKNSYLKWGSPKAIPGSDRRVILTGTRT